jgi:hypothetical protein
MRKKISNAICQKVSDSKILILGGSVYESRDTIKRSKFVFLMNFAGQKSVKQIKDSPTPIFSIYPPFKIGKDENALYIVNEDDENKELNLVKYHIDRFLINIK